MHLLTYKVRKNLLPKNMEKPGAYGDFPPYTSITETIADFAFAQAQPDELFDTKRASWVMDAFMEDKKHLEEAQKEKEFREILTAYFAEDMELRKKLYNPADPSRAHPTPPKNPGNASIRLAKMPAL